MFLLGTLRYDLNNKRTELPEMTHEMRKKCSKHSFLLEIKIPIPNTFSRIVFDDEMWKYTIILIKAATCVEIHVHVRCVKCNFFSSSNRWLKTNSKKKDGRSIIIYVKSLGKVKYFQSGSILRRNL